VHRDLKPSNIFLCDRGGVLDWVKVLISGWCASFTGQSAAREVQNEFAGTPSFMPPEAIKNSAPAIRAATSTASGHRYFC